MAAREVTPADTSPLLATARALEVDRITASIVATLARAGIDSILLKGPVLAGWLYDDGATRGYADCDLLVPPDRFDAAGAVLAGEGFEPGVEDAGPELGLPHAQPYGRASDGAAVDLHRAPSGAAVAPAVAWKVMSENTEALAVGGGTVKVPTLPARALNVAFHASQHGADVPKPIEDLRRAVERAPEEVWREAAALAVEMDATAAFTLGLSLLPEGRAVAARLGLADERLARAAVEMGSGARLALGLERLSRTPGARGKLGMIRRKLFPTREFMQWWSPLARRGPLGLAAAYVWRAFWLVRQLIPSMVLRRRLAGPRGERIRLTEMATLGGPFPLTTKLRLTLEIVLTFPRARFAARRDDDIRNTLATLRGPAPAVQPSAGDTEGARLIFLGQRLGRAVARTMRYLPGDTRCLAQSLVLIHMLSRRSIGSTLVIGVSPDGGFSAHAWVELDGIALLPPREDVFRRLVEL